ncbi:MAG TPA: hypothetical protein VGM90_00555 [Kofleriaceae bacterium]
MTSSLTTSASSRSLFTRALLSPTALALAAVTALSPLASASRLAPTPAPVQRRAPVAPPSNEGQDLAAPHMNFAQPPPSAIQADASRPNIIDIDIVVTKDQVRAALVQARKESVSAFAQYMANQMFPSNTQAPGKLNVWRDAEGHYCAAATIIRTSGRLAISDEVATTNNNLRLITVKDGALMDWILTSGLTQQEIDRIQEPFMWVAPDGTTITGGMMMQGGVDPEKKARETWRLLKTYKATYAALEKSEKASLEVAVNRLMEHPDLARDFLDGSLANRDVH